MTDFSRHLSWAVGFRWHRIFGFQRAVGRVSEHFRFEYRGVSSGFGEVIGTSIRAKLLNVRTNRVLKKVENNLHS
jgi:hypothetical protein